MLDTRSKPRRPTVRAASIAIDKATRIDCVVRDFSEGGVRLEVLNPAAVPNEFVLCLAGVAKPRLCRVAWRKSHELGASFVRQ